MPTSPDGYVSFRGSQQRDYGEITHSKPVILVDLDFDREGVLRLPPAFQAQRDGTVLLRPPDPLVEEPLEGLPKAVENSLADWETVSRVAILTHPLGKPPRIDSLHGQSIPDWEKKDLLDRARAVELEALLEFGQAIWRPTSFHYRLITGEHAAAYIKVGDALRQPRDAEVLASWLHRHVESETGLILDTGTLIPVAQALRLAATREGIELGPTSTLENYPRTVVDIGSTLDRVAGDRGRIIVMLSVSSSGSLLERVLGALERKGPSIAWSVAVLVDKTGRPSSEDADIWTPTGGQKPLVASGAPNKVGCELCRTPGRATVVPINPFTFDAMLPTQFEPVVPAIDDPAENRPLWEAARRTNALAVERSAHEALRRYRSDKVPMGIKLEGAKLIQDEAFCAQLNKRLTYLAAEENMPLDSDLVLAPQHEVKYDGYDQFWQAVRGKIAPGVEQVTSFPIEEAFPDDLVDKVQNANSILVFQLGTVSGASIQRALVGVQQARGRDDDFRLHAFVLHARPSSQRELQTIRNSYGSLGGQPRLRFGWKSILPDRSPLREELVLLRGLEPSDFDPDAEKFLTDRLELCGGRYTSAEPPLVLWGSHPDSELTPHAIYGRALDTVTTYVAVGSAMSAALGAAERMTPELRVFEVAAIARSYFDPLILGCMLRWMRPHEAFWGWTSAEAEATAHHLINRAENLGQNILVPEMLLAAAQGKLTREPATTTVRVAQGMLEDNSTAEETAAILEVGLQLVGDVGELPATEGIYGP